MPPKKTLQNIVLTSISVFLVVTVVRDQSRDEMELLTTERDVPPGDNHERLDDSSRTREMIDDKNKTFNDLSGLNDNSRANFKNMTNTSGYQDEKILEMTTKYSVESPSLGRKTFTFSKQDINPKHGTLVEKIEEKLQDEFYLVHKQSESSRFDEDINKDCETGKVRKSPDVMIVGVEHCETGLLKVLLEAHQKINAVPEETHFFDDNYSQPLRWYLRKMPCSTQEQVTLEESPSYYNRADPARIFVFNPNMKFILVLCDPVNRTLVDFIHKQHLGLIPKGRSFEEEVLAKDGGINPNVGVIKRSNYLYPYVKFIRYFPRNQTYHIDLESLKRSPLNGLNKIEDFLEIEHLFSKNSFWYNAEIDRFCLSPDAFNLTDFTSFDVEKNGCLKKLNSQPRIKGETVKDKLRHHYTAYISGFCRILGDQACRNYRWIPEKRTSVRAPSGSRLPSDKKA